MSLTMEVLSLKNPSSSFPLKGTHLSSSMALALSPSTSPSFLKFQSLLRPNVGRVSIDTAPAGLGLGFRSIQRKCSLKRPIVAFAASHEDSKHSSDLEVEKENEDHLNVGAEESEEAWKQTLESFKQQAQKMQSVSQEAYVVYSKRAAIILKETAEKLQIQADKAKHDLTELAKELSVDGKEYLSTAAENYPEPVKDIVESFSSSTDDVDEISKVRDFHVGIPYGFVLSLGGFLVFMLTGSIAAIRFGIILGGTLLALSVSSLRSYQKGETNSLALKGQTAIVGIFFLRDIVALLRARILHPNFAFCFLYGAYLI
ncbi:hypothetical protein Tsubulata_000134 [Turnera subulata]|uniref:Protein FATTY ACID EXPORT 3, chloroplastic n=1 Tax=Turnera subulata TaxID=218843 RepID=A0A9Q0J921_9ROSI|nr:hypothetical protein Tsubulata_000134 [Turnera subulata]